ncbi:GIY-YIG nuclease family protein [Sphingomonas prati]|uniref:GIY-YIG domain-containing protein n=1 Tax=Sphingomonas prati TaxID=1843237 RepID=A0A7W9BV68_9SPHN|nr:GIY-YIG nuclease family protein [Sphingomonas prati]MBB5730600.1 hypothetical protein [Sphingomonas prati]GGE95244.1 hypothetical protein GCM10011404_30490 [Sphingomonas prati]
MPLRFNMLLEEAGIDPAAVRLLRHNPVVAGRSLVDVWRSDPGLFEDYQSTQAVAKRSSFLRPYWAAFTGTWDGRTMFVGLYAVGTPVLVEGEVVTAISNELKPAGTTDRYPYERSPALVEYAGRLFVDWGGGPSGKRAWAQRAEAQDKAISELHLDSVEQPFPGVMTLTAPLSALDAAPAGWALPLAAARGVYLLSCPRDGSLYVGSATGEGGFWSRWAEYRANGHGGNVALRDREPSDFVVSVLQVAGSTETQDDILAAEAVWKRKFNSRTVGLNRN